MSKNFYKNIITSIDQEIYKKTEASKRLDRHIAYPVFAILIYIALVVIANLFSRTLATKMASILHVVQVLCLLYLFAVVIVSAYHGIKSFPKSKPIIARAELDFDRAEKAIEVLSEFEIKELEKCRDWLVYKIKSEYQIAAFFLALYAISPKILSSVYYVTESLGIKITEWDSIFPTLFLILGFAGVALTILLNTFQKYMFHINYSINHGHHKEL